MSTKKKTIKVTLLRMSNGTQELELPVGATLALALQKGGHGDESLNAILEGVRVNGRVAELDTKLKSGDFITVSPQVKGG